MPITAMKIVRRLDIAGLGYCFCISLTIVYKLQLGNNVQTDVGVFVFEHLEEHRKEMGNSPGHIVRRSVMIEIIGIYLLTLLSQELAQDR